MEEKKTRGVNPNIPHDIVEEIILLKLPLKSLVRFKAVSREWRGAIESKCFVEKHMKCQKSLQGGQARFVALQRGVKSYKPPLQNLLLTSNGILHASPYPPITSFDSTFCSFKFSAPCDGLLCLYISSRMFHLVNPVTTSHRILPDPISEVSGHGRDSLVGIGRENSGSRRYKLVCYFNGDNILLNKSTRCKVFALGSNTWRQVDNPPDCLVYYDQPMMHLDGVMYSLNYFDTGNYCKQNYKLLAFDLHTETFQSFPFTPDMGFIYIQELGICLLNHRICIFKRHVGKDDVFYKIWGLDINKRSWEIMFSIDVSCIPPEFKTKTINPIATINNYVILSNFYGTIWGHSGSENEDFLTDRTSPCRHLMSYVETLVSPYQ